jgi:hypothetical protein
MNATDLCYTPATELARLIRTKAVSPVEVTRAVLDRIDRVNPAVNAFCTLTAETALEAARDAERAVTSGAPLGPLHGVPFSVKDLNLTKGVRTMSGSFIFEHRVPDADAAFVMVVRKGVGSSTLFITPADPRGAAATIGYTSFGHLANTNTVNCRYGTGVDDILSVPAWQGTYVGTIRTVADGRTTMAMRGVNASGGAPGINMFVFNEYNRVSMQALNVDTGIPYTLVAALFV